MMCQHFLIEQPDCLTWVDQRTDPDVVALDPSNQGCRPQSHVVMVCLKRLLHLAYDLVDNQKSIRNWKDCAWTIPQFGKSAEHLFDGWLRKLNNFATAAPTRIEHKMLRKDPASDLEDPRRVGKVGKQVPEQLEHALRNVFEKSPR
jgi:hypothetical protein